MEIRNLMSFIQVAELNSFTKAADVLGYSQSTISFQIKQLETELQCLLFERINHTITLTERGRELLSYAHNVCRLTDEFRQNIENLTELKGTIHVVAPDSVCEDMLTTNYNDFHSKYPGISLKFTAADTGDMFLMLDRNEADLMVTLDNHVYKSDYIIAKEKHIPIRIGVNSGSLDKEIHDYKEKYTAKKLVQSAKKHVDILEMLDFHDIVISLKGSNAIETIEAYKLASEEFPYPLHLGITEAGPKEISLIRSSAGLAPLLYEGIGDTIRISMSDEPEDEIIAAKRLLHDLGLYPNYYTLVSCPTCGRTMVDVTNLASRVLEYLETTNKKIHVAVMGCVVNGPGEAKNADIGIAGGNKEYVIFKKGEVIKKVSEDKAYETLIEEIDNF
jgi:1-hydroxy-2-methyl-2-(E)-butenyl 4-diphosphate synthase